MRDLSFPELAAEIKAEEEKLVAEAAAKEDARRGEIRLHTLDRMARRREHAAYVKKTRLSKIKIAEQCKRAEDAHTARCASGLIGEDVLAPNVAILGAIPNCFISSLMHGPTFLPISHGRTGETGVFYVHCQSGTVTISVEKRGHKTHTSTIMIPEDYRGVAVIDLRSHNFNDVCS